MELSASSTLHSAYGGSVSCTAVVPSRLFLNSSNTSKHYTALSISCSGNAAACRFAGFQRRRLVVFASASTSSPAHLQAEASPQSLVDALLSLVNETDRGTLLGEKDRKSVEELIQNLEQYCMPEPLKSPLLFGDWDVVYSSNPTSSGGYYRSPIGRALLKTNQMIQSVIFPEFVRNVVSFSALGLVDGEVSLEGKLEILDNKWIKVNFDSPKLNLGSFEFRYGQTSSVRISIVYLDERVRLGRGSRGTLFVFKRR